MFAATAELDLSKRAVNRTSRERFPSASTVGGDLGERRLVQRVPVFADTEEVTGSNPVAPTTLPLSKASADLSSHRWTKDRQREVADGRESVYLLTKVFTWVLSCQPAAHTSPDVDLGPRSRGPPSVSPTRLL